MYRLVLLMVALLVGCSTQNDVATEVRTSVGDRDAELLALIEKMTLEEKVGQMSQLTLDYFYNDGQLNKSKLRKHIVDFNVGSVLNNAGKALSQEEWLSLMTLIQDYSKESRLKVPVLYGIDAIHGVSYTLDATLFPHNIGLAATRNTDLVTRTVEITAAECRASGIRWNFDPVLGLGRNPIWPRFEETFGEDPYLVKTFGGAAITAYQGDDASATNKVAACMKHYLGYSVPAIGKDRTPAYISEIELEEKFYPPFKEAVDRGSLTVMINSGAVNGIPVHADKYLLTTLLKEKWGFEGLVVTDWRDIIYLYSEHHVAENNKEAVAMAINAGIDMSMIPSDMEFYHDLIKAVNEGMVPMSRIDDAVYRILYVKKQVGLFEQAYPEEEAIKLFGLDSYKGVALESARQSLTLLENKNISGGQKALPISKGKNVVVAGPAADYLPALHGSWSWVWQGTDESLYPEDVMSIAEAISASNGQSNTEILPSGGFKNITVNEIEMVKRRGAFADYIVLCLGEDAYAEGEGNIDDLALPKAQVDLVRAAAETGKPIILVLAEGRPRILGDVADLASAVLMAYRPGSQGGPAIADVLFGDYNPSGKLPFSYPKDAGNIVTYDIPIRSDKYYTPQWAFGHGLSYSDVTVKSAKLSASKSNLTDPLSIKVTVNHAGGMAGDYAVDLFVQDVTASVIPARRKLIGFKKVHLNSGESKTIEFQVAKSDLMMVNADLEWVIEPGKFIFHVGGQSKEFEYVQNVN